MVMVMIRTMAQPVSRPFQSRVPGSIGDRLT